MRRKVPTFADQDKLPEVWAFIEELFRWRPAAPAGFSHAATEDVFWVTIFRSFRGAFEANLRRTGRLRDPRRNGSGGLPLVSESHPGTS